MPRAPGAAAGTLRRNQACRQCRKRKLKCDAQRPHCGTCQRQWQAQISVPPPVGFTHPVEPACTYDPVEGLQLAPDTIEDPKEKVKLLEQQIAQLSEKLNAAKTDLQHNPSQSINPALNLPSDPSQSFSYGANSAFGHYQTQPATSQTTLDYGASNGNTAYSQPNNGNIFGHGHSHSNVSHHQKTPSVSGLTDAFGSMGNVVDEFAPVNQYGQPSQTGAGHIRAGGGGYHSNSSSHPYTRDSMHLSAGVGQKIDAGLGLTAGSGVPYIEEETGIGRVSRLSRQNEHRGRPSASSGYNPSPEPLFDIMHTGWSRDLPDRLHLMNLVDIFFRCDPCGSRMLHRPSLLNSLNLNPTHPDFPHPALLHAICATASRWTSRGRSSSNILSPPTSNTPPVRDKFAEFHAGKTRQYVNQTMSNGQNIFQVLQACTILSWWFYAEGRWVEVWIQAGFQTRAAVPLGLNYLGMIKRGPDGAIVKNAYLEPPKGARELETRKRAWWMTLMFDRIVSCGGWLHSVDERDIGTELPLRLVDFEMDLDVVPNPQTLHSERVYIHHPLPYTDPYILFLKATMLFGRVTDYTVRMGIRAPLMAHEASSPGFGSTGLTPPTTAMGLGGSSPSQFAYQQSSPRVPHSSAGSAGGGIPPPRPSSVGGMDDPRNAPGFRALDRLVGVDFINSFPSQYRNCLGVGENADGSNVDSDLYMAHLVPHAAAITLHSPWANFAEAGTCPSVARCMDAARAILDKYYVLKNTSYDITWLHPFVTTCWYLAAVIQIHLCKRLIEMGDVASEASCWGEINILRDALLTYGVYSPVGTRQEKLLHPVMQEIINMTSQAKPLSVGLPLYPFSLDSVFRREEKKALAASNNNNTGGLAGDVHNGGGSSGGLATATNVDDALAPLPDAAFGEDEIMTAATHNGSLNLPSMVNAAANIWVQR